MCVFVSPVTHQRQRKMAGTLKGLVHDDSEYITAFQVFLESSTEHQSVKAFVNGPLPDILASIGEGKNTLNVMGVGSGSGEIDLEILHQLNLKHPEAEVDNEVVEPSSDMLHKYKDLLLKTPDIDNVTFSWNNMKTSDFEKYWKEKNPEKKMDFIHMIQMLYYLEDPWAAVLFFRSLLRKNGKLLIILVTGDGGFVKLWKTYGTHLDKSGLNHGLSVEDMKVFLDTKGIPYQTYKIQAHLNITRCFTPGDEKGQKLLDLLTEVQEFSKNASPELRTGVLDLLRGPECSQEVDGKILFNSSMEALVIDP